MSELPFIFEIKVTHLVSGVIIFGLIYVLGGFWILTDASDRFGFGTGCLFIFLYVVLLPLFPLLLLGYFILTLISDSGSRGGSAETLPKPFFPSQILGGADRKDDAPRMISEDSAPPVSERVVELEDLISEGKLDLALSRALDLMETAKSFGDDEGVRKFKRYADRVRGLRWKRVR